MQAIVYISQETQPFTSGDLHKLLAVAVERNRANNLTGCLHYEGGYFMQYIEGEPDALRETVERIKRDRRHRIFYSADKIDVPARRFPDWYMNWEERAPASDYETGITELARSLEPFETAFDRGKLDQALSLYKQIAFDHVLRGIVVLRDEKQELVSSLLMAVHDLRSPARTIGMMMDMYIADAGSRVDPAFLETAAYIRNALGRLNGIVDGVLDHFDTDASVALEPVNTGALVEEIAASTRMSHEQASVVRVGELPVVQADPLRIWRVLDGLISNGLKYNSSDAPRVEVSAERDETCWRFCVRDNGIGIPAEYRERIFELFKRLHPQGAYPGTGIGLATCRKLVEQWQGRIWVTSIEGEGSCFYFTVPIFRSLDAKQKQDDQLVRG